MFSDEMNDLIDHSDSYLQQNNPYVIIFSNDKPLNIRKLKEMMFSNEEHRPISLCVCGDVGILVYGGNSIKYLKGSKQLISASATLEYSGGDMACKVHTKVVDVDSKLKTGLIIFFLAIKHNNSEVTVYKIKEIDGVPTFDQTTSVLNYSTDGAIVKMVF